jgi:hypothetical protein
MQGFETDGEATQRHNKEAEAEKATKQALHRAEAEKADAAGYAAALEQAKADKGDSQLVSKDGEPELEPIQITRSNPFATPSPQVATPADSAPAAAPPAAGAQATDAAAVPIPQTNPTKRKKSPASRSSRGDGDEDDDDEMAEEGGDPNTLSQEVQLRKIHQTLKKFSNRIANNEDMIYGQGRMVDEVTARHRAEEQKDQQNIRDHGNPRKSHCHRVSQLADP